jgi:hypothetical protein
LNVKNEEKIGGWFNSRLKLQLNPPHEKDIVVNRERVKDFKEWLEQ